MNLIKESGIPSLRTLLEDDLTSQSHSCWCQQLGSALLEVLFLQSSKAISCVFLFCMSICVNYSSLLSDSQVTVVLLHLRRTNTFMGMIGLPQKISNGGFYWLGMIVLYTSVRFPVHLNLLKAPPRLAAILAAEVGILNVHVFFSCLSTSTNFLSLNRFQFCL